MLPLLFTLLLSPSLLTLSKAQDTTEDASPTALVIFDPTNPPIVLPTLAAGESDFNLPATFTSPMTTYTISRLDGDILGTETPTSFTATTFDTSTAASPSSTSTTPSSSSSLPTPSSPSAPDAPKRGLETGHIISIAVGIPGFIAMLIGLKALHYQRRAYHTKEDSVLYRDNVRKVLAWLPGVRGPENGSTRGLISQPTASEVGGTSRVVSPVQWGRM